MTSAPQLSRSDNSGVGRRTLLLDTLRSHRRRALLWSTGGDRLRYYPLDGLTAARRRRPAHPLTDRVFELWFLPELALLEAFKGRLGEVVGHYSVETLLEPSSVDARLFGATAAQEQVFHDFNGSPVRRSA